MHRNQRGRSRAVRGDRWRRGRCDGRLRCVPDTGGTILCVDENQVERVLLGFALTAAGFAVEFVDGPRAALERVRRRPERFCAVLLGRGLRTRIRVFARLLRSLRPDLPVVTSLPGNG